jgi:hypothetical protein
MTYTPIILTTTGDYDEVRELLGVTSTQISDAVITSFPFLPTVEAEVAAAITDYATLTGANSYRLKSGTAHWVASLLCLYIEGLYANIQSDGGFAVGDYKEDGQKLLVKMDYRAQAESLARLAAEALGGITTRTWTRPALVVFAGQTRRSDKGMPTDFDEWLEKIRPRIIDAIEEDFTEED